MSTIQNEFSLQFVLSIRGEGGEVIANTFVTVMKKLYIYI